MTHADAFKLLKEMGFTSIPMEVCEYIAGLNEDQRAEFLASIEADCLRQLEETGRRPASISFAADEFRIERARRG